MMAFYFRYQQQYCSLGEPSYISFDGSEAEILKSEFIGEAQTDPDVNEKVLNWEVQLVFLTPETLINSKKFWNMLLSPPYQQNLVALVVDEEHCVKTWGDDLRKHSARLVTYEV